MAKKNGRPSKRTDAITDRIIVGLTAGTPLTVLCKPDDMPCVTTVYNWMSADAELSEAIARARDLGYDAIAKEAMTIIDTPPERVITTSGEDRTESRYDSAAVQWAKNRAEVRLKLLAKWDPKRYGEKLQHANSEGGPLKVMIARYADDPDTE